MQSHQLINQDSGDTEYYTPMEIVEAARKVMGGIDLDPASSEIANERIGAVTYYSKDNNGLSLPWCGRIFMNHPFSKGEEVCEKPSKCKKKTCRDRGHHCFERVPSNADWISYLIAEYVAERLRQSCNITFAATSEDWFAPLHDYPQCYLSPRTNYYLPDGTLKQGVSKGSAVTYLGPNIDLFIEHFSPLGFVKIPAKRMSQEVMFA